MQWIFCVTVSALSLNAFWVKSLTNTQSLLCQPRYSCRYKCRISALWAQINKFMYFKFMFLFNMIIHHSLFADIFPIFLFVYILNAGCILVEHTSSWFPLCPSPLGLCRDLTQGSNSHRRGHYHSYPCVFPLAHLSSLWQVLNYSSLLQYQWHLYT